MKRAAAWRRWLPPVLLWAACGYCWLLPLLRPRGVYLGGHYQLRDVYAGIPLLLAAASVTTGALAAEKHRRPLALRLTTVCVSVLLALTVIDAFHALVVRQAWQSSYWYDVVNIPRGVNRLDPQFGYVRKPRIAWRGKARHTRYVSYRSDEHGFRNPPGIRQAELVFLGDSFTEAAGVPEEDTFVQRTASGAGLRAVNLGLSGYGPDQEFLVLQQHAFRYSPRVVVWQWFEGNDLADVRRFAEWRRDPGRSYRPFPRRYFDQTLLNRLLETTASADQPPVADSVRAVLRSSSGETRRIWVHSPYEPDQPARYAAELAEAKRLLAEAHRACRSRGVRLVVVHVPLMIRVMEPYLTFETPEGRRQMLPAGVTDGREDFRSKLAAHCRAIGCPFVDTLPALRREAARNNRDLYFAGDQHLDVRGHQVVADELVEWLRIKQ